MKWRDGKMDGPKIEFTPDCRECRHFENDTSRGVTKRITHCCHPSVGRRLIGDEVDPNRSVWMPAKIFDSPDWCPMLAITLQKLAMRYSKEFVGVDSEPV